jgi:hypothetical protein
VRVVKKLAVAIGVVLALPASATAATPLVPPFIQNLVRAKASAQAYVPTRAPFRYGYRSYTWNARNRTLVVRLADRRFPPDGRHTVVFSVNRFTGDCAAGNQKSYQVDGNKTYSDASSAWRCLDGVKLAAAGPNLPTVALAQVVASGKRVR